MLQVNKTTKMKVEDQLLESIWIWLSKTMLNLPVASQLELYLRGHLSSSKFSNLVRTTKS